MERVKLKVFVKRKEKSQIGKCRTCKLRLEGFFFNVVSKMLRRSEALLVVPTGVQDDYRSRPLVHMPIHEAGTSQVHT